MDNDITLYEDEFYADSQQTCDIVQLIVLRLSNEWYAVDVLSAREVVKIRQIVFLPSVPDYISGIVNIRGSVLAVTDLKSVFGLSYEPVTDDSRLVVIESGVFETGLLADEVQEVVNIEKDRIDAALPTLHSDKAEYILGEVQIEDKLVGILNVDKILKKRIS